MNLEEREKLHRQRGFLPELIFAWKVSRLGDCGRLLLALLIASIGFAGAAVLIEVRGNERVGVASHRKTASVMILRPDDPASQRLLEWAREQSPFPDRWTPQDSEGLDQLMTNLEDDLRVASRYVPKLRPPQVYAEEEAKTPELLTLWPSVLPKPSPPPARDSVPDPAETVRVVVEVGNDFTERWRPLAASWPGLDYYGLLGKKGRFVIGVDERGTVNFCLAAEGLDPVLDRDLQSWIRRHPLKPTEDPGVVWTTVTVRVLAVDADAEDLPTEGVGDD